MNECFQGRHVDPGYHGRLNVPVHNLTEEPKIGEELQSQLLNEAVFLQQSECF